MRPRTSIAILAVILGSLVAVHFVPVPKYSWDRGTATKQALAAAAELPTNTTFTAVIKVITENLFLLEGNGWSNIVIQGRRMTCEKAGVTFVGSFVATDNESAPTPSVKPGSSEDRPPLEL